MPECLGHPPGPYDQMGQTTYCDGSCRAARRPSPRPTSFAEFNATPLVGPTYTDLAREVDRLKEELAAESTALAHHAGCITRLSMSLGVVSSFAEVEQAVDSLKDLVKTLNRRDGEIRAQAFLDLAHELSEMEPDARDAAIRRIIDNAQ